MSKSVLYFLVLMVFYTAVFQGYFPTPSGNVGHDFPLTLAGLYDGYLWFKNNGMLSPPWFTPSFCGGIPVFPDPQSGFYSIPQLLAFWVTPLQASFLTLLISAAVGYWGLLWFMRDELGTAEGAAIYAAALFMFNGFLSNRAIVGEIGFHGYMFGPLIAWLLIRAGRFVRGVDVFNRHKCSLLAGLLIAYWLQSGLTSLIIPSAMSVVLLLCVGLLKVRCGLLGLIAGSLLAIFVAITVSLSKLVAAISYYQLFPRTQYSLPGVDGLLATFFMIFRSLFFSSEATALIAEAYLVNVQWQVRPHEWAYGLGITPLLILLIFIFQYKHKKMGLVVSGGFSLRFVSILIVLIMIALALIPVIILYYNPWWNAVLKNVSIISSTAWPFRWIIIYLPVVSCLSGIMLDRIIMRSTGVSTKIWGLFVFLIILQSMSEHDYYYRHQEAVFGVSIRPDLIEDAYRSIKHIRSSPPITDIGINSPSLTSVISFWSRNDMVAYGVSQIQCYNPIFGYQLEKFPLKNLHVGSIYEKNNDFLNLKNPACYVYPDENGCEPGDHFGIADLANAERFASYHQWPFKKSTIQTFADSITLSSLVFYFCIFVLFFVRNKVLQI